MIHPRPCRGLLLERGRGRASAGGSGEGVEMITELLKKGGFRITGEGLRELWNPDRESFERCIDFGKGFAKNL